MQGGGYKRGITKRSFDLGGLSESVFDRREKEDRTTFQSGTSCWVGRLEELKGKSGPAGELLTVYRKEQPEEKEGIKLKKPRGC